MPPTGPAPSAILSRDTDGRMEARQIETWRAMSAEEKFALVLSANRAVRALAIAGIKSRYPDADDAEVTLRYAALTLGRELAERVYPALKDLDP